MSNYQNKLVSVIIPIYKCEKYLEACVLSAINQIYPNIEIILVDDCSPDNSGKIALKLAEEYDNIIYERLEKNSGAAHARNRALDLAKGRYVAFLDSDDSWLTDKIDKQMQLMNEKKAFFVYGAIDMVDANNAMIKGCRKIPSHIDYKGLSKNTAIATSTVLIDRNITGEFHMPIIRSGQDYATWMMLLRGNKTAYGVTDLVSHYRKAEGSLSAKKTKNWKKVLNVQVNYEGVPKVKAYFNCGCYIVHALIKYFF
ncbi:MAG: glycosyltransferase family 2 protein [Bacillota bacterium]|nr:glycosyltransferase family 2 protein [Bacillota bacterium]